MTSNWTESDLFKMFKFCYLKKLKLWGYQCVSDTDVFQPIYDEIKNRKYTHWLMYFADKMSYRSMYNWLDQHIKPEIFNVLGGGPITDKSEASTFSRRVIKVCRNCSEQKLIDHMRTQVNNVMKKYNINNGYTLFVNELYNKIAYTTVHKRFATIINNCGYNKQISAGLNKFFDQIIEYLYTQIKCDVNDQNFNTFLGEIQPRSELRQELIQKNTQILPILNQYIGAVVDNGRVIFEGEY